MLKNYQNREERRHFENGPTFFLYKRSNLCFCQYSHRMQSKCTTSSIIIIALNVQITDTVNIKKSLFAIDHKQAEKIFNNLEFLLTKFIIRLYFNSLEKEKTYNILIKLN